ncbi:MAG TPA: thioredoxin family protein [Bacilli bacterium]|nr:thioredoxin family protein [Bacilli bacterium]
MKQLMNWFDKGMSKYEYIHAMQKNKDDFLSIYNGFSLAPEEKKVLQALQSKRLKAIVLTADWCGDAMINLPILMRIAEEALIDVRYLIRDDNLELMDQYLTNGTARSIPIIIFLNEAGEEIAKWGPRSKKVAEVVSELQNELPAQDAPEYQEAFKQFIAKATVQFKTNSELQASIKDELIACIN